MIWKLLACLAFCLCANLTDWKSFRIRNRAVAVFLALGLAANLYLSGPRGLLSALAGGLVMLCLFPLFALRMLGAGDVKALMAVGCMLGWPMALSALAYSILAAGVLAVCVLLFRKNGRERLKYFLTYCKLCWYSRSLQPYAASMKADSGSFRFSFGITLGILALLVRTLWTAL
ncbi:MAG: prepilin peptidase [Dysosmobacter sp.]|nr:A24 family peptidase [Dysosmobacter sp.]